MKKTIFEKGVRIIGIYAVVITKEFNSCCSNNLLF